MHTEFDEEAQFEMWNAVHILFHLFYPGLLDCYWFLKLFETTFLSLRDASYCNDQVSY